jgi:hypothetical protein
MAMDCVSADAGAGRVAAGAGVVLPKAARRVEEKPAPQIDHLRIERTAKALWQRRFDLAGDAVAAKRGFELRVDLAVAGAGQGGVRQQGRAGQRGDGHGLPARAMHAASAVRKPGKSSKARKACKHHVKQGHAGSPEEGLKRCACACHAACALVRRSLHGWAGARRAR